MYVAGGSKLKLILYVETNREPLLVRQNVVSELSWTYLTSCI
jgi:hypothetical protein